MANNPKANDNLKPFQPGDDSRRNTGGRPKKIYTIIKEMGYTTDDIRGAFNELGFYDMKELKVVETDKTKPVIVRIVAKQFRLAFEKGDVSKIKEIMERVLGREPLVTRISEVKPDSLGSFYDAFRLGQNGNNITYKEEV